MADPSQGKKIQPLFISRELIRGESSKSLRRRIGRLPVDRALEIAAQLFGPLLALGACLGRNRRGRLGLGSACLTALISLLLVGCASSGGESNRSPGERVDALFQKYLTEGSPGAAVMVIREGTVLHSKGYGLADLEAGHPLTPTTPVRLGSLTKAFTAFAIVLLAEDGELSYDELASRWVPEIERFPGITVRHLLNHTSGLPDYYGGSPLEQLVAATGEETLFGTAEAISIYRSWGDPVFGPGERFEYSNPGYEVLGLIAERASGRSVGEFLKQTLFDPLGMSTAAFRDHPETILANRAVGYSPKKLGRGWEENDDHSLNWVMGAGGMYASLEDLYLWDQALGRWAAEGDRLREVFAPATLTDGSLSPYGFGWSVSDLGERAATHHTGAWVGFRSAISRYEQEGLTVIVLSNCSGPAAELRDSIAAIYLEL
ncbi:MAG: beta-lactamase family protein [Deltaproteobacteria bacterium]|nr:beta-lactamase family protein [Deltaproteobacteria bacterium]